MEKLFGLEMATIAGVLSGMLLFVIASLGLLAWRRPVFLKLGLRPIPRRKAQSILIVLGLMLGAVTWAVALRWRSTGLVSRLRDAAARPRRPRYRAASA